MKDDEAGEGTAGDGAGLGAIDRGNDLLASEPIIKEDEEPIIPVDLVALGLLLVIALGVVMMRVKSIVRSRFWAAE